MHFAFNLCVELALSKCLTKATPEKRHKKKFHTFTKNVIQKRMREREKKCREAFISLIPIWQKRIKKKACTHAATPAFEYCHEVV